MTGVVLPTGSFVFLENGIEALRYVTPDLHQVGPKINEKLFF